jgi:ABC-2 type transport system permease protein
VPGGGSYREYLMPGLFAMTSVIGLLPSALMVSKDVAEGVVDRFRSMPMARSAVPFGRTLADLLTGSIGLAIMVTIGLLAGWRAHEGIASAAAAFGLVTLLRYSLSWGGVFMGLSMRPETVDSVVPLVFPVTMISNSFVPTAGMPGWLRATADWNPVSALVAACRQLFGNPGAAAAHASWPLQHPITATIGWSLLLLAVFVPLATRPYQAAHR